MLQDGEVRLSEPKHIEDHVLDYFRGIFGVKNNCVSNDLVGNVIPMMVTDCDNLMLTSSPFIDEIKRAIFDLNGEGAPGPDGFGGHFFSIFGILLLTMWFTQFKIFSIRG
jgi:hypothetical protein